MTLALAIARASLKIRAQFREISIKYSGALRNGSLKYTGLPKDHGALAADAVQRPRGEHHGGLPGEEHRRVRQGDEPHRADVDLYFSRTITDFAVNF